MPLGKASTPGNQTNATHVLVSTLKQTGQRRLQGIALSATLLIGVCVGVNAHATNTCTQENLTRLVTVVYSSAGQPIPCEVLYEKPTEGQSMTLWRAENQTGYCEARAAEFVKKLESLGWSCNNSADTDNTSDEEPNL